jgi:ubiquinone/menaquinone biosynthesis C-methylase UbiE
LFAKEVGDKGTVYAVDISPAFVKYVAEQAKQRKQDHIIKPVRNTPDSTDLPAHSIDVAFLCNTYHHFDHPEKMLASIHRALRRDGRLVVIDFDLSAGSEFVRKRARATKDVYFREITDAGFEQIETKGFPTIKDNFGAEFRRAEQVRRVKPAVQTDRPQSGR